MIWLRELKDTNSLAVVLQNTGQAAAAMSFQTDLLPTFVKGWPSSTEFKVRNLLNHTDLGTHSSFFTDNIETSSVGMYKLTKA